MINVLVKDHTWFFCHYLLIWLFIRQNAALHWKTRKSNLSFSVAVSLLAAQQSDLTERWCKTAACDCLLKAAVFPLWSHLCHREMGHQPYLCTNFKSSSRWNWLANAYFSSWICSFFHNRFYYFWQMTSPVTKRVDVKCVSLTQIFLLEWKKGCLCALNITGVWSVVLHQYFPNFYIIAHLGGISHYVLLSFHYPTYMKQRQD